MSEYESIKQIADHIRFRGTTEQSVLNLLQEVYNRGYRRGQLNQITINHKTRHKYLVLLDWMKTQLTQFSFYTKRPEYTTFLDGINDISSQYLYENALGHSGYGQPCRYKAPHQKEIIVDGESVVLDYNKEINYLLVDLCGLLLEKETNQ